MARAKHVSWTKEPVAKVAKMLAWAIVEHEGVRNTGRLWERFAEILPAVSAAVLGEEWSRDRFVAHIAATQEGREVTPNMLRQRADKAQRYGEWNDFGTPVLDAYLRVAACRTAAAAAPPVEGTAEAASEVAEPLAAA